VENTFPNCFLTVFAATSLVNNKMFA